MRRRLRSLLAALACAAPAAAHPGHGIAVDSRGQVHFVDLSQESIWAVATDGTLRRRHVGKHLHCLTIDADDNLYFDHQEYGGPTGETRSVSVWRLEPGGTLTSVRPAAPAAVATSGRPVIDDDVRGPGLLRDERGASYGIEYEDGADAPRLVRTETDGRVVVVAPRLFAPEAGARKPLPLPFVQAKTWGRDGSILVTGAGTVRRITRDGLVTCVGGDPLAREPARTLGVVWQDSVLGVAEDEDGSVYAADYGRRCVRRIDPDDAVTTVHRSAWGWSPTGVTVADGDLYVLENRTDMLRPLLGVVGIRGGIGGPRVVRITPAGERVVVATVNGHRVHYLLGGIVALIALFALLLRRRAVRGKATFPLRAD